MSLSDPRGVWTAATVSAFFTGDPIYAIAQFAAYYYVLGYPLGEGITEASGDPVANWNFVTRPFYFAVYGVATAFGLLWAFDTPVLIPTHASDASSGKMRRCYGLYTLLISVVSLIKSVLFLAQIYAPGGTSNGTVAAGLPVGLTNLLVLAFAGVSVIFIGLVHLHTYRGDLDSSLAIAYYGAAPGDTRSGIAILAYAWFLALLLSMQSVWDAPTGLPHHIGGAITLAGEAVILFIGMLAFARIDVLRYTTKRLFSRKSSGIGWSNFVFVLIVVFLGVGIPYAFLEIAGISAYSDLDWVLWGASLVTSVFAAFYTQFAHRRKRG